MRLNLFVTKIWEKSELFSRLSSNEIFDKNLESAAFHSLTLPLLSLLPAVTVTHLILLSVVPPALLKKRKRLTPDFGIVILMTISRWSNTLLHTQPSCVVLPNASTFSWKHTEKLNKYWVGFLTTPSYSRNCKTTSKSSHALNRVLFCVYRWFFDIRAKVLSQNVRVKLSKDTLPKSQKMWKNSKHTWCKTQMGLCASR